MHVQYDTSAAFAKETTKCSTVFCCLALSLQDLHDLACWYRVGCTSAALIRKWNDLVHELCDVNIESNTSVLHSWTGAGKSNVHDGYLCFRKKLSFKNHVRGVAHMRIGQSKGTQKDKWALLRFASPPCTLPHTFNMHRHTQINTFKSLQKHAIVQYDPNIACALGMLV